MHRHTFVCAHRGASGTFPENTIPAFAQAVSLGCEMVEFDVHNLQKIKMFVHIAQVVVIVVAWIMEIVVFKGADKIDGRPGWYFGLVNKLLFTQNKAN